MAGRGRAWTSPCDLRAPDEDAAATAAGRAEVMLGWS
jgi:hypothetical protein